MGDKDEQGKQDEQAEVKGHVSAQSDAEELEHDETPDVEGHKRFSPSPRRSTKRF